MKNISVLETKDMAGDVVELYGWVNNRRDHGKIIFIDLRDRSGVIQIVFTPGQKEMYELASQLRGEWVICVRGKVAERPANMVNPEIPTGKIEIQPEELKVLSKAETPPFEIGGAGYDIDEEARLKYRYLDLRRERLQRNIKIRSEFVQKCREFLFSKNFLEIETPVLTKSTPEGSRDFVVPSRLHSGKFFALPQSPQQYKQLLMVAGFERYFQIAKCFRDEDLRADRAFEHSQIDIEMSFVEREDVMAMDEEMITTVAESMGYKIKKKPFPKFTFKEAVEKFGSDKFDFRTEDDKKNNILAYVWVIDFPFFEKNKEGRWTFTHNPFSQPKEEHIGWVLNSKNISEVLTTQYDLVCNGHEVGGGSIRSHQPEVLKSVFKIIGHQEEDIEKQFGHMLQAFSFGAPPHGGLAHGVERNIMVLTGEEYLREVQAFPQTASGRTSVMDAPSELTKEQLKELHLKLEK